MPISELILQATSSRAAATILTIMLAVCFINGTFGCITSASRLTYAMARDDGIIFPRFFSRISPKLDVPVRTIGLCFVFNLLFGLLYMGPSVAFSAYSASCTIFLNLSYAIPVIVLIIRGRDVLIPYQTESTFFKLGKRSGLVINCVAASFVVVTSIFFCFPTSLPVSGSVMNYVSVVIGIFLVLITSYWVVYGKRFQGPKFEVIMGHQPGHMDEKITVDTK